MLTSFYEPNIDQDFEKDLSRFETRPDDIYVVSYPKSGKAVWIENNARSRLFDVALVFCCTGCHVTIVVTACVREALRDEPDKGIEGVIVR